MHPVIDKKHQQADPAQNLIAPPLNQLKNWYNKIIPK